MEWENKNNRLFKSFEFVDFLSAFSFMTRVALLSEKMDHHPTLRNTYNIVEIWLSTHDEGDTVTQKDIDLADAIDKVLH